MKKDSSWANPENFSAVFRCTTVEFANSFINKGQIKFNTPQSWVDYALQNSEGRGDKLEGTMATCHIFDCAKLKELNEKYSQYHDLIRVQFGKHLYLKRTYTMELPCFCFYILKHSMFDCPNSEGPHRLSTTIPGSYFRDFMDNLTPEEVVKMPFKSKPAIIAIHDFETFQQRLISSLLLLGIRKEEILVVRVSYLDFKQYGPYGWWDFGQLPPKELTIKSKRFENQSEARIIINTNDPDIKSRLAQPIEIGPLNDIATVCNTYLHDGMLIEATITAEQLDK